MTYTNYSDIYNKLYNVKEFKGNSASAVVENHGKNYSVYSYGTKILELEFEDVVPWGLYNDEKYTIVKFDNSFYSVTTSRLQNLLIEVYGLNDGIKNRD